MPSSIAFELHQLTEVLTKEFCEIRDHERVSEIFEGLYIYDSSLPIPSKDFILLISFAVLRDDELLEKLEEQTVEDGRISIITKFVKSNDEKAKLLAKLEARRRLMVRYLYPTDTAGDGAADWNELVHHFRYGTNGNNVIWRSVSQQAIELLTTRAILLSEFKSLEGLARATKESHLDILGEVPKPAREIASHIIWNQPILQEQVDWPASKEAIKLLILTLNPYLSDSPSTWANAWKMFPTEFTPKSGTAKLNEAKRAEIIRIAEKIERQKNATDKRPGL